jgi:hypothetical protein
MKISNNFEFPQPMIDEVVKSFRTDDSIAKFKKLSPCRVMVNGKFVVTDSGKTIWRRVGDAKSAVKNHLAGNGYRLHDLYGKYFGEKQAYSRDLDRAFMNFLYSSGVIKIVPLAAEEYLKLS